MSDQSQTDAERLAAHTHFSSDEAAELLSGRSLVGDPADDEWSHHVVVTPDEVVLKRPSTEGRSDVPSALEIAEASKASVEKIRNAEQAFEE